MHSYIIRNFIDINTMELRFKFSRIHRVVWMSADIMGLNGCRSVRSMFNYICSVRRSQSIMERRVALLWMEFHLKRL